MKCVICKNGVTGPGTATVTLNRRQTTIIVKGVSADVCTTCGEYYLSPEVAADLERRAESAIRNGAEIEIIRYAA